jgi:hypothetical protein
MTHNVDASVDIRRNFKRTKRGSKNNSAKKKPTKFIKSLERRI